MTVTDEQRQAHRRVLRWSHALLTQLDRLHEGRAAVVENSEKVRAVKFYGPDDALPFYMLDADKHFALVAARQLLRALNAFDGDDRLPATLPEADVRLVRDALEHWDEPAGRANKQMAKRGADPTAHSWGVDGDGVLGEVIKDAALREWAAALYAELVTWDPW